MQKTGNAMVSADMVDFVCIVATLEVARPSSALRVVEGDQGNIFDRKLSGGSRVSALTREELVSLLCRRIGGYAAGVEASCNIPSGIYLFKG